MNSKQRVIVTGGAGFIGRCMVEKLLQQDCEVVVFDDFSTSSRENVEGLNFFEVDLKDVSATRDAFASVGNCDGVIHFAARALVSESCENPHLYFQTNLMSTLNVAESCVELGIPRLVYSSSCAVYGKPQTELLEETHPKDPFSPYGESKWMGEKILEQYSRWKPLKVISLRYFNPAGSISDGRFGEGHEPETHLIPNVVKAIENGDTFRIFGDQYPTKDGTCERDLIHIADLIEAHWLALAYLEKANDSYTAINLGTGRGTSVKEVVRAAEKVLSKSLKIAVEPPRRGDPASLIADAQVGKALLGWEATRNVEQMILDHHRYLTRQTKQG